MPATRPLILATVAAAVFCARVPAQTAGEVTLRRAADSLTVTADLFRANAPADSPAILLFHQGGGDARGEYGEIVPVLLREGFHVLAADIRGGGTRFSEQHRGGPAPPGFRYCQSIDDINMTIDLARANGLAGPLILWGSSYSATVVIQASARRSSDVRAVLAFSPALGEPMQECQAEVYVPSLVRAGIPLLVVRPAAELELPRIRHQFDRLIELGARGFVAQQGAHGSSTLVQARVQGDIAPQWSAVLEFLRAARLQLEQSLLSDPQARLGLPSTDEDAQRVTIESDGWRLQGDLVMPAARPAAVVLMMPKAAGGRRVYRVLARELAAIGIGSLRLDLRGHGESTNRGRFIPSIAGDDVLSGSEHDVAAALRYLRALDGVDTARLGIVSASYSSEAAAQALRKGAAVRAFVALSPGSFSDTSASHIDGSGASWLFVRGDREAFVGEWLDKRIRTRTSGAEIWVLSTGSAHASDLLLADAALPHRLATWLRDHLHQPPHEHQH